jgi:hypothetical protein
VERILPREPRQLAAAERAALFGDGKPAMAVRVRHQEPASDELADQRQPRQPYR